MPDNTGIPDAPKTLDERVADLEAWCKAMAGHANGQRGEIAQLRKLLRTAAGVLGLIDDIPVGGSLATSLRRQGLPGD